MNMICCFWSTVSLDKLAHIGEFMGGVLGTIIAACVLWYVRKTFYNQRDELIQTRKYLNKQQFESVYFKMLDMINEIGKNMKHKVWGSDNNKKILIDAHEGDHFFIYVMGCMKKSYKINVEELKFHRFILCEINKIKANDPSLTCDENNMAQTSLGKEVEFTDHILPFAEAENEKYVGILYQYYFNETHSQLGHYFRYIYNVFQYIIERSEEFENDDFKTYINLIQAQLSNNQLAVMFYNAISPPSKNSKQEYKFKELLIKYDVFQNLQRSMLLDEKHQDFYLGLHFKDPYIKAPVK